MALHISNVQRSPMADGSQVGEYRLRTFLLTHKLTDSVSLKVFVVLSSLQHGLRRDTVTKMKAAG